VAPEPLWGHIPQSFRNSPQKLAHEGDCILLLAGRDVHVEVRSDLDGLVAEQVRDHLDPL